MISRRTFLGQAGLLSTGVIIMPKLLLAKTKGKYGLQLYSFREQLPKDVKGVIAKIAEAGYKQVETFGYSKANGFWGLSAKEFSKLLKLHNLSTSSGHYGLDSFLQSGQIDELDQAIETANILGQSYITVPYIGAGLRKTASDFKSIANWINIAAERVKREGMKLSYHNHNFEFENIEGQMLLDVLLKSTTPDLVDFEMDVYWVVRAGQDPVKWIENHPGRFRLIHVKDMDKNQPELNTEVGIGNIDYKRIFLTTRDAGIKYYIVEQENFKIDPYASIAQSNKYLREMLG